MDVWVLETELFQGYSTQHISVCWVLYDYASSHLSHSTFLFLFLPVCLCVSVSVFVCVLPAGKIRQEL